MDIDSSSILVKMKHLGGDAGCYLPQFRGSVP